MLSSYQYMEIEGIVKRFRQDLYAHISDPNPEVNRRHLANIIGYDLGHLQEFHIGQTDGQLIKRQLEHDADNKHWVQSSSCFFDDMMAEEAVMTALYRQAPELLTWVRNGKTPSFVLTIDSGDEDMMFGRGFDEQFREKESTVAKIIIDRSKEQSYSYGFFVKTAYVDITVPQAQFTGIEYDHQQIAAMDEVEFESAMEEVAFVCHKDFPDIHMQYGINQIPVQNNTQNPQINDDIQNKYEEYIKLSYNRSSAEAVDVYITQDGAKAKLRKHKQATQRLRIKDLEPEKRNAVNILQQKIREKEQCKNASQEQITFIQPSKDIAPAIPKTIHSGDAR